jgi:predicted dehydrogenase
MSLPQSSRRTFLKTVSAVGASALLAAPALHGAAATAPQAPVAPRRRGKSLVGFAAPKLDVVRWGFIGLGARGGGALRETMGLDHCEIVALCDNHAPTLKRAVDAVAKAGRPAPAVYGDGPEAWRKMIERSDLDAVLICTPWRDHTPMAVATMRAGKHAFSEVPIAISVDECWQLVDTAEETQRHCMMLENVNYGREELMLLNMCRQGVFGELLHAEAAYIHDLRMQMKHIDHGTGSWRLREHELRDGNLYPTHGLGPVAHCLGINRGDKFDRVVAFSSPSRGAPNYAAKNFPAGHARRAATYVCGDMNTAIVKTALGRTIMIQHDTMNPRPYSRHNLIQGANGVFAGFPDRIYIEGRSPKEHTWETDLEPYYKQYDHPLWTKVEEVAKAKKVQGGHGGMDYVMRWRIVQCLREGRPLDQSVYDGCAWSVIGPLSEQSVAQGGMPIEVPDFTRGAWQTAAPVDIKV